MAGTTDPPILDAHQHFWDVALDKHPGFRAEPPLPFRYGDTRALRRTYLPADYLADAAPHRVVHTVYVETEWDPADPVGEMRWLHALPGARPLVAAAVAQARLDRPDAAEVLAEQARFPLVRGIRHKPAAAPSPAGVTPGAPGTMGDARWREGYRRLAQHGLHFELQTPWWHLREAADLARAVPDTLIVLNHTGLPADRSPDGLRGWAAGMAALASVENAVVKISGLGLPGRPWTVEDNRPVVLQTIERFGIERCLFASNYPVDGLVASFDTIYTGFLTITRDLSAGDRRRLFHDNAVRVYRTGAGAGQPSAAPATSGGTRWT